MATLEALNGYSIDMSATNFNYIDAGFYAWAAANNISYNGVFYPNVVEYDWIYAGPYGYESYSSIFGGSFTTTTNEFGTPVPIGGTITGYVEQIWNGSSWIAYGQLSDSSVSATQVYNAILTTSTVDDLVVISQMYSGSDTFLGGPRNDNFNSYSGNDTITGGAGNDTIDGGTGSDTASYVYTNLTDILISKNKGGGYTTVTNNDGTDVLTSIEILADRVGSSSISTLYDAQAAPTINYLLNGAPATVTEVKYSGMIDYIDMKFIGSADRQNIQGTEYSEFMNLLGGIDAANGNGGDDILDGGRGSNFLTGGSGQDTFYVDGRGGANTWSTITDLTSVDTVRLWGWQDGVSQLVVTQENVGANGFKGITYFYDLDGNNLQETKLTFSGLSSSDLNEPSVTTGVAVPYVTFTLAGIG